MSPWPPGLARLGPWGHLPAAFLAEVRRFGLRTALRKALAFRPRALYHYEPPGGADAARAMLAALPRRPCVSVLVPVYNTEPRFLRAAVQSVVDQDYPEWELCLVDDASTRADTRAAFDALDHPRLRRERLPANAGIAAASNRALALATGEFVALLDHDDLLTRDALLEMVRGALATGAEVLYSDEDLVTPRGTPVGGHLKPDYAPDLLLAHNYITHLLMARRDLVTRVGAFRSACDGAQDYDLTLRLVEQAAHVAHVRRVLYHWRMSPASTSRDAAAKPYAADAGRRALEDALRRRGIAGTVEPANLPHYHRVRRRLLARPRVSILIPFRDRPDLLTACVDALLTRTAYPELEILLVDNDSREPATAAALAALRDRDARVRVLAVPGAFNYAQLNNTAAAAAAGEQLVLMNNDITVISPDWVGAMLEQAQRPEVGAVGAKLYYPNGRVQHAGIILGVGGTAGHAHRHLARGAHGYLNRLNVVQNFSAVTAALMMVRREVYRDAGGLDAEHLPVALNDVDFCLRLRERGLLIVFTPFAEAYHAESASRGVEDDPVRAAAFAAARAYLLERHRAVFAAGDPYYHPRLTLETEDFSYARPVPRGRVGRGT